MSAGVTVYQGSAGTMPGRCRDAAGILPGRCRLSSGLTGAIPAVTGAHSRLHRDKP
ncbi:hypothetical protein DPMN_124682 [Dreissena polymorpha]|uniref:Uncharacterized protein n=1 Tax=Dreissena polymorpha TaxID=45954 RepID=A0A9D4JWF0_DREPO|nr:hypothetical protein DPMN_124682 [Dreissena polymorpha]